MFLGKFSFLIAGFGLACVIGVIYGPDPNIITIVKTAVDAGFIFSDRDIEYAIQHYNYNEFLFGLLGQRIGERGKLYYTGKTFNIPKDNEKLAEQTDAFRTTARRQMGYVEGQDLSIGMNVLLTDVLNRASNFVQGRIEKGIKDNKGSSSQWEVPPILHH